MHAGNSKRRLQDMKARCEDRISCAFTQQKKTYLGLLSKLTSRATLSLMHRLRLYFYACRAQVNSQVQIYS